MKSSAGTILRTIAWSLILAFSFEQLAYAAPSGSPSPAFAASSAGQQRTLFDLPTNITTLDEVYRAPSSISPWAGKTLVLIQDPHTNDSGQMNVARIVDHLVKRQNVRQVFTEGGQGDVSLTPIKEHLDLKVRKDIGMRFLRRGLLQGSEYANLTSENDFTLYGVEDPALYDESLQSYKVAYKGRAEADRYLSHVQQTVRFIKSKVFSKELAELDTAALDYEESRLTPMEFLQILESAAERRGYSLEKFKELTWLRERLAREAAASDKDALPEDLDEVRLSKVIEEIRVLSDELLDLLAADEDSKQIAATDRRLRLMRRMLHFQSMPDQMRELRESPRDFNLIRMIADLNARILTSNKNYERLLVLEGNHEEALESARHFYALTEARDRSMVARIKERMAASDDDNFVLVTGGFHSDSLKALLKSENLSFASFVPRVDHETDQRRYEKLLLSQATGRSSKTDGSPVRSALMIRPIRSAVEAMDGRFVKFLEAMAPSGADKILGEWPQHDEPSVAAVGTSLDLLPSRGRVFYDQPELLTSEEAARIFPSDALRSVVRDFAPLSEKTLVPVARLGQTRAATLGELRAIHAKLPADQRLPLSSGLGASMSAEIPDAAKRLVNAVFTALNQFSGARLASGGYDRPSERQRAEESESNAFLGDDAKTLSGEETGRRPAALKFNYESLLEVQSSSSPKSIRFKMTLKKELRARGSNYRVIIQIEEEPGKFKDIVSPYFISLRNMNDEDAGMLTMLARDVMWEMMRDLMAHDAKMHVMTLKEYLTEQEYELGNTGKHQALSDPRDQAPTDENLLEYQDRVVHQVHPNPLTRNETDPKEFLDSLYGKPHIQEKFARAVIQRIASLANYAEMGDDVLQPRRAATEVIEEGIEASRITLVPQILADTTEDLNLPIPLNYSYDRGSAGDRPERIIVEGYTYTVRNLARVLKSRIPYSRQDLGNLPLQYRGEMVFKDDPGAPRLAVHIGLNGNRNRDLSISFELQRPDGTWIASEGSLTLRLRNTPSSMDLAILAENVVMNLVAVTSKHYRYRYLRSLNGGELTPEIRDLLSPEENPRSKDLENTFQQYTLSVFSLIRDQFKLNTTNDATTPANRTMQMKIVWPDHGDGGHEPDDSNAVELIDYRKAHPDVLSPLFQAINLFAVFHNQPAGLDTDERAKIEHYRRDWETPFQIPDGQTRGFGPIRSILREGEEIRTKSGFLKNGEPYTIQMRPSRHRDASAEPQFYDLRFLALSNPDRENIEYEVESLEIPVIDEFLPGAVSETIRQLETILVKHAQRFGEPLSLENSERFFRIFSLNRLQHRAHAGARLSQADLNAAEGDEDLRLDWSTILNPMAHRNLGSEMMDDHTGQAENGLTFTVGIPIKTIGFEERTWSVQFSHSDASGKGLLSSFEYPIKPVVGMDERIVVEMLKRLLNQYTKPGSGRELRDQNLKNDVEFKKYAGLLFSSLNWEFEAPRQRQWVALIRAELSPQEDDSANTIGVLRIRIPSALQKMTDKLPYGLNAVAGWFLNVSAKITDAFPWLIRPGENFRQFGLLVFLINLFFGGLMVPSLLAGLPINFFLLFVNSVALPFSLAWLASQGNQTFLNLTHRLMGLYANNYLEDVNLVILNTPLRRGEAPSPEKPYVIAEPVTPANELTDPLSKDIFLVWDNPAEIKRGSARQDRMEMFSHGYLRLRLGIEMPDRRYLGPILLALKKMLIEAAHQVPADPRNADSMETLWHGVLREIKLKIEPGLMGNVPAGRAPQAGTLTISDENVRDFERAVKEAMLHGRPSGVRGGARLAQPDATSRTDTASQRDADELDIQLAAGSNIPASPRMVTVGSLYKRYMLGLAAVLISLSVMISMPLVTAYNGLLWSSTYSNHVLTLKEGSKVYAFIDFPDRRPLATPVEGIVTYRIPYSSPFKPGDILLQMENPELEARLIAAKANLKAVQAEKDILATGRSAVSGGVPLSEEVQAAFSLALKEINDAAESQADAVSKQEDSIAEQEQVLERLKGLQKTNNASAEEVNLAEIALANLRTKLKELESALSVLKSSRERLTADIGMMRARMTSEPENRKQGALVEVAEAAVKELERRISLLTVRAPDNIEEGRFEINYQWKVAADQVEPLPPVDEVNVGTFIPVGTKVGYLINTAEVVVSIPVPEDFNQLVTRGGIVKFFLPSRKGQFGIDDLVFEAVVEETASGIMKQVISENYHGITMDWDKYLQNTSVAVARLIRLTKQQRRILFTSGEFAHAVLVINNPYRPVLLPGESPSSQPVKSGGQIQRMLDDYFNTQDDPHRAIIWDVRGQPALPEIRKGTKPAGARLAQASGGGESTRRQEALRKWTWAIAISSALAFAYFREEVGRAWNNRWEIVVHEWNSMFNKRRNILQTQPSSLDVTDAQSAVEAKLRHQAAMKFDRFWGYLHLELGDGAKGVWFGDAISGAFDRAFGTELTKSYSQSKNRSGGDQREAKLVNGIYEDDAAFILSHIFLRKQASDPLEAGTTLLNRMFHLFEEYDWTPAKPGMSERSYELFIQWRREFNVPDKSGKMLEPLAVNDPEKAKKAERQQEIDAQMTQFEKIVQSPANDLGLTPAHVEGLRKFLKEHKKFKFKYDMLTVYNSKGVPLGELKQGLVDLRYAPDGSVDEKGSHPHLPYKVFKVLIHIGNGRLVFVDQFDPDFKDNDRGFNYLGGHVGNNTGSNAGASAVDAEREERAVKDEVRRELWHKPGYQLQGTFSRLGDQFLPAAPQKREQGDRRMFSVWFYDLAASDAPKQKEVEHILKTEAMLDGLRQSMSKEEYEEFLNKSRFTDKGEWTGRGEIYRIISSLTAKEITLPPGTNPAEAARILEERVEFKLGIKVGKTNASILASPPVQDAVRRLAEEQKKASVDGARLATMGPRTDWRTDPAILLDRTGVPDRELTELGYIRRLYWTSRKHALSLLEKLRFLGIADLKLDELLSLRVHRKFMQTDRRDRVELLKEVYWQVNDLQARNQRHFKERLLPRLESAGVHRLSPAELRSDTSGWARELFESIKPDLLDRMIELPQADSGEDYYKALKELRHQRVQIVVETRIPGERNRIFWALRMPPEQKRTSKTAPHAYAGRIFTRVSEVTGKLEYVLIEDVVMQYLNELVQEHFAQIKPGKKMIVQSKGIVRVTKTPRASGAFIDHPATRLEVMTSSDPVAHGALDPADDSLDGNVSRIRDFMERFLKIHDFSEDLEIREKMVWESSAPLNLKSITDGIQKAIAYHRDEMERRGRDMSDLGRDVWKPLPYLPFAKRDPFDVIREKDQFAHTPEDEYPMIRILEESSLDPKVREIKWFLYRSIDELNDIKHLDQDPQFKHVIESIRQGKVVRLYIEGIARGDEKKNAHLARKLARTAAKDNKSQHSINLSLIKIKSVTPRAPKIGFGMNDGDLKVHAKAFLVVREEEDGREEKRLLTSAEILALENRLAAQGRRLTVRDLQKATKKVKVRKYVALSTGNFHPVNTKHYTDMMLFSADDQLADEVDDLFDYVIDGKSIPVRKNPKLFFSPDSLAEQLHYRIREEIRHEKAKKGSGLIVAKMNHLDDPATVQELRRAAEAGVRIVLIVREINAMGSYLPAGYPEESFLALHRNVTIKSVIGEQLEHSRIFYFGNGGKPKIFLSSADWMPRNLYRRVETAFLVTDPDLMKEIAMVLNGYFSDVADSFNQTHELDGSMEPASLLHRHVMDDDIALDDPVAAQAERELPSIQKTMKAIAKEAAAAGKPFRVSDHLDRIPQSVILLPESTKTGLYGVAASNGMAAARLAQSVTLPTVSETGFSKMAVIVNLGNFIHPDLYRNQSNLSARLIEALEQIDRAGELALSQGLLVNWVIPADLRTRLTSSSDTLAQVIRPGLTVKQFVEAAWVSVQDIRLASQKRAMYLSHEEDSSFRESGGLKDRLGSVTNAGNEEVVLGYVLGQQLQVGVVPTYSQVYLDIITTAMIGSAEDILEGDLADLIAERTNNQRPDRGVLNHLQQGLIGSDNFFLKAKQFALQPLDSILRDALQRELNRRMAATSA